MQCDSAAHHMSGNDGSTLAVGYGSTLEVGADRQRRGAALHAVAVALVVDAPQLVGDQLAVVVVQRRVGVDVDHRRSGAVAAVEHLRVDRDLALLQVPVRPHVLAPVDVAGRRADVDRRGSPSIYQICGTHGPTPTMTCSTSIAPWSV